MVTILIVIIVITALSSICMYNSLIKKKNQVEFALAGINVQIKKRHDLIPNLVSAVKEYMQHERELLEKITALRIKAISHESLDQEKIRIEETITSLLRQLMITVENYPNLKANENFLHLQSSLNEIEEQIAASRRAYNSSVTDFNNAIQVFPTNIIAKIINFRVRPWFEIEEEEKALPKV